MSFPSTHTALIRIKPHFCKALLLFGFLLLSGCSGGDNADGAGTSNCTLGTSTLDDCKLK